MIWYSHWFIHPVTAISTKRNRSRWLANPRGLDEVVRHVLQRAIRSIGWKLGLERTGRELYKVKEELGDLAAGDEGDTSVRDSRSSGVEVI